MVTKFLYQISSTLNIYIYFLNCYIYIFTIFICIYTGKIQIFSIYIYMYTHSWAGSVIKNPPAIQKSQETQVGSLCQEDLLEEGMATHSSILAWRNPRTEEPGGLPSIWLHSHFTQLKWFSMHACTILHSIYWTIYLSLYIYIYHTFFIHSSIDGHFSCL